MVAVAALHAVLQKVVSVVAAKRLVGAFDCQKEETGVVEDQRVTYLGGEAFRRVVVVVVSVGRIGYKQRA